MTIAGSVVFLFEKKHWKPAACTRIRTERSGRIVLERKPMLLIAGLKSKETLWKKRQSQPRVEGGNPLLPEALKRGPARDEIYRFEEEDED